MKLRYQRFVLLLPLLLFACSKGDVTPSVDYTDAIQLQIGDYWVHQHQTTYGKATTGTLGADDSTYIRRDTVIGGNTFYALENQFGLYSLQRKVGATIVDQDNTVFFSGTNFTDTIYRDPFSFTVGVMQDEKDEITVPAGKFKTVVFIILARNPSEVVDSPTNAGFYNAKFSILSKTWYAKDVGVVRQIFYYDASGFLSELKRYHIVK